jgi:hypothetical protein
MTSRIGSLTLGLFFACAAISPAAQPGGRIDPGKVPASRTLATSAASVVVHGADLGPAVSRTLLGVNMAVWEDITTPGLSPSLTTAGITAVRWPGGSSSDVYHWQNNAMCNGGYGSPNSTFDNFMQHIAQPANLDVAITLDYGSNAACNAGGDPTEAAAWVAYSKSKGYGVRYWTVGNEEYGSWEEDLHSNPHDPTTYANAVATGYYPDIKAADPNAQVGVVVDASSGWDTTVLKNAKYDFIELHYYAQGPGSENDGNLILNGPRSLTSQVATLHSELQAVGRGSTPIYLGELGSVYTNPGKQAQSISQALFAGLSLAELARDNVFRATWWLGYGGCNDSSSGANFSSSLYGWQNFGGYMIFSDGTPEYGCSNATPVPTGTLLPTARAFQVMSSYIQNGERITDVVASGATSRLRAYAVSRGTSYALALFNLDGSNKLATTISIDNFTSGSSVQTTTYGRAQYDLSRNNVWAGPVSATSGKWLGPVTVTLPAWSMTVVTLKP